MLKAVFAVIKSNQNINKLRIFEHDFCTLHMPMTPLLFKVFDKFSKISGLKPKLKCGIAGIGALKGLRVALCGMQCISLNEQTVTILGIHFSYN